MKRRFFRYDVLLLLLGSVVSLLETGLGASVAPQTRIQVRLNEKLETGQAQSGQTFSGTIARSVTVGGRVVLARGTRVKGRVVEAVSSGRLKRPASITLELTQVGGASIRTEPLRLDEQSHVVRNAELIGGGAATGTLLGAAAGGKKGAAVGAAAGAGAGSAVAYFTGKKEIVLPPETWLTFVIASSGGSVAEAAPVALPERRAVRRRQDDDEDQEYEEREEERRPAFSEHDREIIVRYFRCSTSNLPPGLAKRGGNLPPGLERHLERNGTLPPGLEKRVERFPVVLERQLPRLPRGYSRVMISGRAIIIDGNNRILDLMFIRE